MAKLCEFKEPFDDEGRPCGLELRLRYVGNDPESGPARYNCKAGHWMCERCDQMTSSEGGCVSDLCEACERITWFRERPPGIRLIMKDEDVGPREDPYTKSSRTVVMADERRVTLVSDALAEETRLIVDGMDDMVSDRFDQATYERIHEVFEELTGLNVQSFDEHYYLEGGEGYVDEEVRAAELAAGWDPNP